MNKVLFIGGVVLFMLGFLTWAYDQPKADLVSQGIGQLALLDEGVREQYRVLQEEIFLAKTMMAFGVIIMIPGIVLKKKSKPKISTKNQKHLEKKSGYICEHCAFIGRTEGELLDHYNEKHPNEKKW